jgi:hypothetical protein
LTDQIIALILCRRDDSPDIDAEDWQIAFEPYKGNATAALSLGFRFTTLKEYLIDEPPKIKEAIEAIDLAIGVLFPFTDFTVSRWTCFGE